MLSVACWALSRKFKNVVFPWPVPPRTRILKSFFSASLASAKTWPRTFFLYTIFRFLSSFSSKILSSLCLSASSASAFYLASYAYFSFYYYASFAAYSAFCLASTWESADGSGCFGCTGVTTFFYYTATFLFFFSANIRTFSYSRTVSASIWCFNFNILI